eukprot:m.61333 g.61333  ORF g.61333 m.61333 type:complete len:926 (+) comp13199_c0_seq2:180-2957(+)
MMAAAAPRASTGEDGDDRTAQGLCSFLDKLPAKPETTFRFIDRGEFYSVHQDDALWVAREVFCSKNVIKYYGSQRIPSVTLSRLNFESLLRDLLLVRQYRVELYESKGRNNWSLVKKGSPGNLTHFEELLFGNAGTESEANMMAVKLSADNGQLTLGVAFVDATQGTIRVCEFPDNDQFSNFEALLVQIGARECLMAQDGSNPTVAKLQQVLERSGVLVTIRKKTEFHTKDIQQDLSRLLKGKSVAVAALPEMDLKHAMAAVQALISFLELMSNEASFGQFKLSQFDFKQYMKLDAAAVRALSLLPVPTDRGNKTMSLAGLLNQCKTAQGSRLLAQWVKQPLLDPARIEERLDVVELFVNRDDVRTTLQNECLRKFPDLHRLAKKLHRKNASVQDCVRIYQAIHVIPSICDTLRQCQDGSAGTLIKALFLEPLTDLYNEFEKYRQLIETLVDLELTQNHEFVIKADYSEELQVIREDLDALQAKIPRIHKAVARSLNLDAVKALKMEQDSRVGFFLRVTRKDEKHIRTKQSKYQVLETTKAGVKFTTTELSNINAEFKKKTQQYDDVSAGIVAEMIEVCKGYSQPMESCNEVVATLDVFLSLAEVAGNASSPYVRPKIAPMGQGDIRIQGCRHPCVEVQDGVTFIPNDVHLIRDKSRLQIITGPNMGGKSTYIRSIGVVVLMAQMGCFVPATSATIAVTDSILARVGAGDSQLKGVSTFMAEMLETASILQSASKDSLIIIDELGRGTSTYDGFGLAWAISEFIAKEIKAYCLFATHFHEITALSEQMPGVTNLHVEASTISGRLTLLYNVKPGICDQSFGIHVAQLADFPDTVVKLAKRKAAELEDFGGDDDAMDESEDGAEGSSKRHRELREAGEQLIAQFLDDAAKLDTTSMSPEEATAAVASLRDKILSENNGYIAEVLGQ